MPRPQDRPQAPPSCLALARQRRALWEALRALQWHPLPAGQQQHPPDPPLDLDLHLALPFLVGLLLDPQPVFRLSLGLGKLSYRRPGLHLDPPAYRRQPRCCSPAPVPRQDLRLHLQTRLLVRQHLPHLRVRRSPVRRADPLRFLSVRLRVLPPHQPLDLR